MGIYLAKAFNLMILPCLILFEALHLPPLFLNVRNPSNDLRPGSRDVKDEVKKYSSRPDGWF